MGAATMKGSVRGPEGPGALPEPLVAEFEALGLGRYEARVLLTLLRLESATSTELARHSGVPRTSIHQVIEEMEGRGLAQRVDGNGPARWRTSSRDEVLDRLSHLEEERVRNQRARVDRIRATLSQLLPDPPTSEQAYVHVLPGFAQVGRIWDQMLGDVESELLVYNRGPYANAADQVNPAVLAALDRGVDCRVLYEADQWIGQAHSTFRRAMDAYHQAGVRGRMVDRLPVKLAVADRRVALLTLTNPVVPETGFPTTLLVEHPGFADQQADAFDQRWSTAKDLE